MTLLLTLYLLIYLVVSYMTIYRFNLSITRILRMVFGIAILFFASSILMGVTPNSWWVLTLVLALVINIEITAFKFKRHDIKGLQILNTFTVMLTLLIIILTFYIYGL